MKSKFNSIFYLAIIIAAISTLNVFVIPLFISIILLFFIYKKVKTIETETKEFYEFGIDHEINRKAEIIKENELLKQQLQKEFTTLQKEQESAIKELIRTKEKEYNSILAKHQKDLKDIERLTATKTELISEVDSFSKELSKLTFELELADVGIFEPAYDFDNSDAYKNAVKDVRQKQKDAIKNDTYATYFDGWTVDGSAAKGKKMLKQNLKLMMRSFNNECDILIDKVTFKNLSTSINKIKKAAESINKLNEGNRMSINDSYISLKLDELQLMFELRLKREQEREEQIAIREQIREEQKALAELERKKAALDKEQRKFNEENNRLLTLLSTCAPDEVAALQAKLAELQGKLADLDAQRMDIEQFENNTKLGHVYIVSNIGAFGENVYKIGMTRRQDPMDRVAELSSASVPFKFDVHAIIFAEDAPGLENKLHKHFHSKRVNKANFRKEFFNVTIDEIENAVKANFDKTVEFTRTAVAEEFYQSKSMVI